MRCSFVTVCVSYMGSSQTQGSAGGPGFYLFFLFLPVFLNTYIKLTQIARDLGQ